MIGIVDYGMGNIRSVTNALSELGEEAALVSRPEALRDFEKMLLPGVGAFAEAIQSLRASGMASALDEYVTSGKPLLGICLGMQLVCRESTEDGKHRGLGYVDARALRFPSDAGVKVPHMGWNTLEVVREGPITKGLAPGCDVYFVHSYYVDCANSEDVVARCRHGVTFTAILARDNVWGMQFHPEKSQQVGLTLLRNFVDFAPTRAAGRCRRSA